MARRLTTRQSESAREASRVGMILRRLQDHLEGKLDLSQSQTTAAKTLLDRAMPVLSAVEMTTAEELPQEGTLIERVSKLLEGQQGLQVMLWQYLTEKLFKGQGSKELGETYLQAILSSHIGYKRTLLEGLTADMAPKEVELSA